MARFVYRMQNILNVKYKLEEQAKQNYMMVRSRLNEANAVLEGMELRKRGYFDEYRSLLFDHLAVLEIEECKNAILLMDGYIAEQKLVISRIERELEEAVRLMNEAMKERKIHEKLRERRFEEFLQELNQEELKEIDQLISYTYNDRDEE